MNILEHPDPVADIPIRRWRIVVENTPGIWRYIAAIVPFGLPDGGFALIPAYHGRDGLVSKVHMKDTFSHLVTPPQPVLFDDRQVTRRIKLSFHRDGATQISAADISTSVFSGPDGEGDFRGIGIFGHTFEKPVFTGGVFGLNCWGLEHYPRANSMSNSICFNNSELGRKGLLGRGAVLLTGYLLSRREAVERFDLFSQTRLRSVRWNGSTGRKEHMELRLINLRNEHSYLAIECTRIPKGLKGRNLSGFIMSSQRSQDNVGILAFFPPPKPGRSPRTLDRGALPPEILKPLGYK